MAEKRNFCITNKENQVQNAKVGGNNQVAPTLDVIRSSAFFFYYLVLMLNLQWLFPMTSYSSSSIFFCIHLIVFKVKDYFTYGAYKNVVFVLGRCRQVRLWCAPFQFYMTLEIPRMLFSTLVAMHLVEHHTEHNNERSFSFPKSWTLTPLRINLHYVTC